MRACALSFCVVTTVNLSGFTVEKFVVVLCMCVYNTIVFQEKKQEQIKIIEHMHI